MSVRTRIRLLRNLATTFAKYWTLCRRPARWCPLCGESSSIVEWRWLVFEARDEQIICAGCCGSPRLWLTGVTG